MCELDLFKTTAVGGEGLNTFPHHVKLTVSHKSVVPNLGPPDVIRLQLPEILASRVGGKGFWEL